MLTYLQEAENLASALQDTRRLGFVAIHTGEYFRQKGRFTDAGALAERAVALGDKLQDRPLQLYARHYLALACHALGDYRRASDLLRVVVQSPQVEWRFGGAVIGSWEAFQAITLAWLARCLAECGDFDEGLDAGRRAVTLAEGLDSPYSLAIACIGLGSICVVKGDLAVAIPTLERACTIAQEANLALYRPQASRVLGCALVFAGRFDEGQTLVRAAAADVESRRLYMQEATVQGALAEASLLGGDVEAASAAAQRALTLARERHQRGDEAAVLRILSGIAARDPSHLEGAVQHYGAAIALAGELGMRPLLGRCHLDLGRLYLRSGDGARAEDQLLVAARLFGEMDMQSWNQHATVALNQARER